MLLEGFSKQIMELPKVTPTDIEGHTVILGPHGPG